MSTAQIKINGHLSKTIHLQRGCCQGYPASPGLFNLFIEPLAQLIRQETALEGITIGGTEHKICLYTDNVLVALKKPASSVPLLMDLLTMYGTLSGYTLNIEKTQALVFNFNPPQDLANRYNFKWNSTSIKYLGVKLTKDTTHLYNENYTVVNKKIGDDFDRWFKIYMGREETTNKIQYTAAAKGGRGDGSTMPEGFLCSSTIKTFDSLV